MQKPIKSTHFAPIPWSGYRRSGSPTFARPLKISNYAQCTKPVPPAPSLFCFTIQENDLFMQILFLVILLISEYFSKQYVAFIVYSKQCFSVHLDSQHKPKPKQHQQREKPQTTIKAYLM